MNKTLTIREKLTRIQTELKAPKNQYNNFGKYKYRSLEDIMEALKPIMKEVSVCLVVEDDVKIVGERVYIVATATLYDSESEEWIKASALARESLSKKGMDESQITGTASSYARKYCLNGLFAIDDTKDADSMDNSIPTPNIDKNQVQTIKGLVSESGTDINMLCSAYSIANITQLKQSDFQKVVGQLQAKLKKAK